MNTNISLKELTKGSGWAKKHSKNAHESDPDIPFELTTIGGPIGTATYIRCALCDLKEDITDYDLW